MTLVRDVSTTDDNQVEINFLDGTSTSVKSLSEGEARSLAVRLAEEVIDLEDAEREVEG